MTLGIGMALVTQFIENASQRYSYVILTVHFIEGVLTVVRY